MPGNSSPLLNSTKDIIRRLESKSFKPIIKGGKEALNPTKDVTDKTGGRLGLAEIREGIRDRFL
jgi:hypothetical protein